MIQNFTKVASSLHQEPEQLTNIGEDIRALRKARGHTLHDMAEQLGRSIGWLSQVEREKSVPSISDLRQIAEILMVPVSMFFGHPNTPEIERGYVVRAGARRQMGSSKEGLIEELLSPDLTDNFEMVHSTFLPRSKMQKPAQRQTQELGFVLSGALNLEVGERRFTVGPGDSFRIRGEVYRWSNPYDETAVVIWVIGPSIY